MELFTETQKLRTIVKGYLPNHNDWNVPNFISTSPLMDCDWSVLPRYRRFGHFNNSLIVFANPDENPRVTNIVDTLWQYPENVRTDDRWFKITNPLLSKMDSVKLNIKWSNLQDIGSHNIFMGLMTKNNINGGQWNKKTGRIYVNLNKLEQSIHFSLGHNEYSGDQYGYGHDIPLVNNAITSNNQDFEIELEKTSKNKIKVKFILYNVSEDVETQFKTNSLPTTGPSPPTTHLSSSQYGKWDIEDWTRDSEWISLDNNYISVYKEFNNWPYPLSGNNSDYQMVTNYTEWNSTTPLSKFNAYPPSITIVNTSTNSNSQQSSTPQTSAGADPYINPIYGNKYKLPDRGGIYRFLDNNDFNNRFLMNIQCWDLPNDKKLEIKDYIYNQLKYRYQLKTNAKVKNWMSIKNIQIPKSAVFIRYLFISNNNELLIFDLEKFTIVNKEGEILKSNEIPKIFSINNENMNKSNLNILAYDQIQPNKELQITTITKTYGKVTINLMKYNNPQIRNAYNVKTEIPITKNNSRGALLGNQEISNIIVNNLNNNDIISEFKLKATDNLKEIFIDEYGKSKLETF